MSKTRILLLIAAFLAFTLGSFVWYIVTWDARKSAPTGSAALQLLLAPNTAAGGSDISPQATGPKDSAT